MNRLLPALAALCVLVSLPAATADSSAQQPPNIVLFVVDDLGWTDLGCMGSSYYRTPRIDGLAAHGMRFTAAYSAGPNCPPGRASLLTGMYPPAHRMYTVGTSARGPAEKRKLVPIQNTITLAPIFLTLAESLKRAGYSTASIGKWQLSADPRLHGFDVAIAGAMRGSPKGGYFSPYGNPRLADGPKGEYLTDRLTDEAIAFLRKESERPFLLYLSHYAVHAPLEAPQELIDHYEPEDAEEPRHDPTYAAMIESVDKSLGRILDYLDEADLADNTLVCLLSDNGGVETITPMAPLRGGKGTLYEGGIRVPMIVRWPGQVRPGSVCDEPVIGVDIYPTLMEATGALPPHEYTLEGKSLVPLLTERGSLQREAIFWHFPVYLQSPRGSEVPFLTRPSGAIRMGRYKLIEFFEGHRMELYDLEQDPGEADNLANKMPDRAKELRTKLRAWRRERNAPVPKDPNPDYKPG